MIFTPTAYLSQKRFSVGNYLQGGIVAYLSPDKTSGIIIAETDLTISGSLSSSWEPQTYQFNVTTNNTYLEGYNSTELIYSYGFNTPAANSCAQLTLNGYTDWFLPNQTELSFIYGNKASLPNFTTDAYWSSYTAAFNNAFYVDFNTGAVSTAFRDTFKRVRPARYINM